jgi:hypothetical protein
MQERLQPILALLDEGMIIYRRHFLGFLLIAASWFVPLAIAFGVMIGVADWLGEQWVVLLIIVVTLLSLPLLVYLLGGLSRAAAAAVDNQPVRWRAALSIRPRRAAGMGCFTLIYLVLMQIVSSAISIIFICPIYLIGISFTAAIGQVTDGSALGAVGLALFSIFFGGIYVFSLMVGGASYSSLIYALQPWVQEAQGFGATLERSFMLVGHRFVFNVTVWALAAAVLFGAGISVLIAVGVLLPLPLIFALGDEAPIVLAIASSAWMIGLVVLLPPLPIWMTLLYRRNSHERAAADLVARVAQWRTKFED